jgi:hypothetical protein
MVKSSGLEPKCYILWRQQNMRERCVAFASSNNENLPPAQLRVISDWRGIAMSIITEIISGIFCGYLVISLCESFFHRIIQHASLAVRAFYKKLGWPGALLTRAWYSHHVVHHFLTFKKNHVTQFSSDEERNWLNSLLEARRGSDIIECKYGLVLGGRLKYYLMYMTPTLPLFILICGFGGIWFKIGACIPLCVWPTLAELVHPYLHAPYRHLIDHGPFAVRILARTAYFRYLAQHHWLHHRYTDCNYNLLLGGDYFLRAIRI